MGHYTNLYCAFWGAPSCAFLTVTDAVRMVLGTFAFACLALWAFGLIYRRR